MEEPVTIVDRDVLKILSVDTRMDILKQLSEGDRTPSDLAKKLKKTDATIVEHLDVMCRSGLVKKTEQPGKKWVFYSLSEKGYGIVSSKSRRLVIILGTSLIAGLIGIFGFGSYSYLSSGLYSRMSEPMAESVPFAAEKPFVETVVAAAQIPWLLYTSLALIALSLLGIGFYFYKRSRSGLNV